MRSMNDQEIDTMIADAAKVTEAAIGQLDLSRPQAELHDAITSTTSRRYLRRSTPRRRRLVGRDRRAVFAAAAAVAAIAAATLWLPGDQPDVTVVSSADSSDAAAPVPADTVGWYRRSDGSWHLTNRFGGPSAAAFVYGSRGAEDVFPVAGDWDGDGTDTVGWYRQSDGSWHLTNRHGGPSAATFVYGSQGAQDVLPVAADWDGSGGGQVTIADIEAIWGSIGSTRSIVQSGLPSLNDEMRLANITTPARKAAFLATLRNESGFRYNAVEAGSATYRGRGFIQLTGSFNYAGAGAWLNYDLSSNPAQASSLRFSAKIARWYWTQARNINPLADRLDMAAVNVAIGYRYSAAEDAERCQDFKAALRHFNGGELPGGINCTRGATAASQPNAAPVPEDDIEKGPGVGP
jgi:predicted chitinase